ncbi:MAG: IS66 family insertion sequence element accessory protein TnpA [Planctomycetota bacterium]|jgi:hypothetical protein
MKRYELPAEGFPDRELREAFWRKVIMAQRKSRQTRIEFCKRNGLSLESFKNWVTKLNREIRTEFIQLEVEPKLPSISGALEIRLSTGDILKLSGEPLLALLEAALKALRKQRC